MGVSPATVYQALPDNVCGAGLLWGTLRSRAAAMPAHRPVLRGARHIPHANWLLPVSLVLKMLNQCFRRLFNTIPF